jgi:hypothetical protein
MHFLGFTIVQILWTFTFASILVLLVVLLGRDRARWFPLFTASIALTALRLLASRMLYGRMAPITMSSIFLTLALIEVAVSLLVLVEIARRAFAGASRRTWLIGTLLLLAVGGVVMAKWGPWPPWRTLAADSALAVLRLMQLAAQKIGILTEVLTAGLGLLVILFGRRFKAGWRSHTQQIAIGLSTMAIAQIAVRGIWEQIALHAAPTTQAEYEHVLGIQEKLYNANSVVYIAVVVWWIACLWIDEPGAASAAEIPAEAATEATET